MLNRVRHLLLGSPLPTGRLADVRLNKVRALASFSPDALSSIAYANQEIYLGLVLAGAAGLALTFPMGVAITALLLVVALSYFQTIHAYPSGGGSYVVARENLGTVPGLVAGAALLVGYLLTAAVSLTAGVEALASAFPFLWEHRVPAALTLLAVVTILNLRGVQETGTLMSVPVYLFLFTYLPMIAYGVVRLAVDGGQPLAASAPPAEAPVTALLALRTFAAGCTALTGIEAIANGVPAFRPPEQRNAGRTLMVMAGLMAILFLGSSGLIQGLAIVAGPQETILSALGRRLLGSGFLYLLVQAGVVLVLAVAANTSFAGFPRLAALLAADRFAPRQLTALGDRLVYANGILLLAGATAALILFFGGDSHALIPLFAVGVFIAFTLSQAGMVIHWWRERGPGWQLKALLNGLGATVTGVTTVVIGTSRFVEGAWITVAAIPLLVAAFLRVRAHYRQVAEQLSLRGVPHPPVVDRAVGMAASRRGPRVVVPISGVQRAMIDAVTFARSISDDVTGLYVELEPGAGEKIRARWEEWWPDVPLVIKPSPYRSIVGPLIEFLDESDQAHADGQLATVVLPEFVPARWWHALLHNQTTWLIRAALLYRRRRSGFQRVIVDVPYHLKR
ncbi:MAG TPA: APC family permease [Anaerolineae bacterium]|nr:APC family permease [Anaerolineae bacterium]